MSAFIPERPRTCCRVCSSYPCVDGTACEGNPPMADCEIRLTRASDYRYVEFTAPDDPKPTWHRFKSTPRSPRPRR